MSTNTYLLSLCLITQNILVSLPIEEKHNARILFAMFVNLVITICLLISTGKEMLQDLGLIKK